MQPADIYKERRLENLQEKRFFWKNLELALRLGIVLLKIGRTGFPKVRSGCFGIAQKVPVSSNVAVTKMHRNKTEVLVSPSFTVCMLSGAAAGTAVDVSLFPLDTLKTRLQSSQGFWKAGGFSRIYSGIGPAALGSAPNAALFFVTYEWMKSTIPKQVTFFSIVLPGLFL